MKDEQNLKKIAAASPVFSGEDIDDILPAIRDVLESGWLILGKQTLAFETAFKEYVGVDHAVAVNSCSSAMQIMLRFYAVKDREVILPTNNFSGDVSSVLYEGGLPVLAEMDPETFCVDVDDAIARITPRTAGMVVVHLGGLVVPGIDRLREVCKEREIFLIEDAAHAHGASIGDRKAGSLVDAACFSFYPTKIMTSSAGGMITTQNEELADYARLLRHHGQGTRREQFVEPGNNWCMSEIHAILGLNQLAHLDEYVAHRNRVVGWYREGLDQEDWITIPRCAPEFTHAYYKLPTLIGEDIDRNLLRYTLENEFNIENGTIYDPPCHLQGAFRDLLGLSKGAYPKAEAGLARQLCPPMHSAITREEVERVVDTMKEVIDRCRSS